MAQITPRPGPSVEASEVRILTAGITAEQAAAATAVVLAAAEERSSPEIALPRPPSRWERSRRALRPPFLRDIGWGGPGV